MDMEKDNIEKDVDIDIRDEKHYIIVTASRLVYLHASRLELFSIGQLSAWSQKQEDLNCTLNQNMPTNTVSWA